MDLDQLAPDDAGAVDSATDNLTDAFKEILEAWLGGLQHPDHPANLIIPTMSLAALTAYVLWLAERRGREEGTRENFETELREIFDNEVTRVIAMFKTVEREALH